MFIKNHWFCIDAHNFDVGSVFTAAVIERQRFETHCKCVNMSRIGLVNAGTLDNTTTIPAHSFVGFLPGQNHRASTALVISGKQIRSR